MDYKILRINSFLESFCASYDNLIFIDNDLFFRDDNMVRIDSLFRSKWNIHPSNYGATVLEESFACTINGYYCACGLNF